MRRARQADVPTLVNLMGEFYRESDLYIETGRASWAFSQLLSDERLGRVWILEADDREVGYIAMTLGFSLEYGGLDAFIDDLFVQARYRRRGLGRAAVDQVLEACRSLGVRAVHLEVAGTNAAAQELYRQAGFMDTQRTLRTLKLEPPVHR
jgi:ribosomal protein S18 acetylase RimI-like enzyme